LILSGILGGFYVVEFGKCGFLWVGGIGENLRERERERGGGVIGRCGAAINRKKKNRLGCEMSLYFFGL
jgi:hypothetical protein